MVYITGDLHADKERYSKEVHPFLRENDILFVLGDFGYGFWDTDYYHWMTSQNYEIAFLDGNHENYSLLAKCTMEIWHGGIVHRTGKNCVHLIRGEIYDVMGEKKMFCFGGAASLDRYRRIEGISWWRQELPTEVDYNRARENLQQNNNTIDIVLTHTAPRETVYYLSLLRQYGIQSSLPEGVEVETFLDEICHSNEYKMWFFGHFHLDVTVFRNQRCVFNSLIQLDSGEVIHQWDSK